MAPQHTSRKPEPSEGDSIAARLLAWYDRHHRELPWRVAPRDLVRGIRPDPYRVWLSEVMLQQTTVEAVKAYFAKFTARWPSVETLAAADRAWLGSAFDSIVETAATLVARLRPARLAHATETVAGVGYNRQDVDRFGGRLVKYFQDGRPMSVEEVRTVTFREQRGGYREAQVDLLLDSVTDVMLAVR